MARRPRIALLLALPFLCAAALAVAENEAAIARILADHRSAVGGSGGPATLELEYAYSASGLNGTAHSIVDRATGAYVSRYVLGPSHGASGFDGRRAWMQDISGAYTPQDGGDRRQVAVNEAYRNANGWWRGDRGGARIELVGRETIDEGPADHLRVTPRGGKVFDAWFDAATHHLARTEEMQQFFRIITRFRDYAPAVGSA